MRRRYVPRAVVLDSDEGKACTADTVIVDDDENAVFTGLYDASGTPLYRVREQIPFGFGRKE